MHPSSLPYPITIIPPIIRADYIATLRTSNKGDNQPFINFISCCVRESQKEYLRLLESLDRRELPMILPCNASQQHTKSIP